MATYTWIGTTGSTPWETTSAWLNSSNSSHPTTATFTAPGSDFLISGSNLFTINNIGAGGTGTPDIANSLTLSDIQASLLLADGHGALDVTTNLSLSSLLNLGTAVGGSVLSLGGSGAPGGTIQLNSTGRLEGAKGDTIVNLGTTPTEIMGSGTVIAEGGLFQIGSGVQVASGDTTQFQIKPNATLGFADAVAGGTIVFTANSGSGVLDVGSLSTFQASVKSLSVGTTKNDATSYIDFLNVGTAASATLTNITSSGATLTVFTNSGSQTIPIVGNYLGKNVNYVSDGSGGTNVFITDVPCYCAGTAILTPDGEVAVETIQPGDVVMTSDAGRLSPREVVWAGVRHIDLAHHPKPAVVAPIRFHRGSLGHEQPCRDLLVSPDHCMLIDGGLVPAKLLVNDMTIVRDLTLTRVSYHHIELERHTLLIAEGVEAESYLDTGNRAYFSNAGLAMLLHPEFGINEHLHCWETDACAPLLVRPKEVQPFWDRFAERARWLGATPPARRLTTDPDLHLIVDGRPVYPLRFQGAATEETTLRFVVSKGAGCVRLVSRSSTPTETRPWLDDPRRLGVAVSAMTVRDKGGEIVLRADHPALTDGWHAVEQTPDGASWRWTNGDAAIPIVLEDACLLDITLSGALTYIEEDAQLAA